MIPLKQTSTVGQPYFSDGDAPSGGHGQNIDGIESHSAQEPSYHIHAHLSLFDDGKQIAIPKGIGIIPPWQIQQNFIIHGQGFYWIHTHDATGIIHIEAPRQIHTTLGQFFRIWGEPLSSTQAASFRGTLTVFINGKQYQGDPNSIQLPDHESTSDFAGKPLFINFGLHGVIHARGKRRSS